MCKKITAVILVFALLCALSACGGQTAQYEAKAVEMLNAIYYEDVEAAYALLHPEIGLTPEDYEKGFVEYIALMAGVAWDHYNTVSVSTNGSLSEGKTYRETCTLTVTLKDERELTLEYVYLVSPEGEGFLSFSLAGKEA